MQMLGNTHTSCACAGRTGQGALQVQPAAIVGRRPAAAAVGAAIGATVAIGAAIGAAVRAAPAGRAGAVWGGAPARARGDGAGVVGRAAGLAPVVERVQRGRLQRVLELGGHDLARALGAARALPDLRVRLPPPRMLPISWACPAQHRCARCGC